jgi:murein DD-endopeptidase MepM/ murein hydrolase activator NlpD
LAGAGPTQAWPALLALLTLLGTTGCAVAPKTVTRPLVASATVSEEAPPPLELGELREPHPEPELISVRHKVAPGETMYRIAKNYGITVEELSAANGIEDPRTLALGQELVIPGFDKPPPSGTSTRPPMVVTGPARPAPRPAPSRPIPETKGTLDWPLRGVLYARFGKKGREPHDGIDLAVPAGTPVKTGQEGEVLYAGEQRGYGLIVIIRHSERLITLYAHNRDLRVRTGQKVRRGQVIATVGESGKTSGPQLHFEVRVDGKPVDPLDYLGPLPSA